MTVQTAYVGVQCIFPAIVEHGSAHKDGTARRFLSDHFRFKTASDTRVNLDRATHLRSLLQERWHMR